MGERRVLKLPCPVLLVVMIKCWVLHLWNNLSWAQEELSAFWLRWTSVLCLPKWRSRSWSGWLTVVWCVPESPSGFMKRGSCPVSTCLYLFTRKICVPKLAIAFQEFCPNNLMQWVSSKGMSRAQGSSLLAPCNNHQAIYFSIQGQSEDVKTPQAKSGWFFFKKISTWFCRLRRFG